MKKGLFSSFQSGFPVAVELGSPQKIVNRHGFFSSLLHLFQMDESVRSCDFKVFFVVSDHAAWHNIRNAVFDFRSENLQVDVFSIFGQQLGV